VSRGRPPSIIMSCRGKLLFSYNFFTSLSSSPPSKTPFGPNLDKEVVMKSLTMCTCSFVWGCVYVLSVCVRERENNISEYLWERQG
jgi:hypothetical protein